MWYITGLFENCHFLIKWKWQRAHHTAALYKRLLFPLPAAVLKWMASGCEYITLLSACRGVLCWLQWHHIVATLETNSCLLHLFTSECIELQQTTILWIEIPLNWKLLKKADQLCKLYCYVCEFTYLIVVQQWKCNLCSHFVPSHSVCSSSALPAWD
jgi:hypothetical protein